MKKIEEKIKEAIPTLVVFEHAANQNAVDVKYLLHELREQFDGQAEIVSVDASYDGNLKERYKLTEYPTWILFKQGQELMRESGEKSLGDLTGMLKRAL